jgi:hypothetical protein
LIRLFLHLGFLSLYFNGSVCHALTDWLVACFFCLVMAYWRWITHCARTRHLSMHSACPAVSQYSLKRWHSHYIIKYRDSSFFTLSQISSHWLINSATIHFCPGRLDSTSKNSFFSWESK